MDGDSGLIERSARLLYAAWLLHVQEDLGIKNDGIDGWTAVSAWGALPENERVCWRNIIMDLSSKRAVRELVEHIPA